MKSEQHPDPIKYPKLLECPLCEKTDIDVIKINGKFHGFCLNEKCEAITPPFNTKLEAYEGWNIGIGIHGHGTCNDDVI